MALTMSAVFAIALPVWARRFGGDLNLLAVIASDRIGAAARRVKPALSGPRKSPAEIGSGKGR